MATEREVEQEIEIERGEWWEDGDAMLDRMQKMRNKAERSSQDWMNQATECYRFVAGKQWDDTDVSLLEQSRRPVITFNRIGPIINAICGQQVANRQETRYLPAEPNDIGFSEAFNEAVKWARDRCDAEDEESQAFRDMVITGLGWTFTRMEFDEDPQGMIVEDRRDPRRMKWDPGSRKKNLADARWVMCDYWYTRDEINELWPDVEDLDIAPENSSSAPEGEGQTEVSLLVDDRVIAVRMGVITHR